MFRTQAETTEVSPPENVPATTAATAGGGGGDGEEATAAGGGVIVPPPAMGGGDLIGDLLALDMPSGGDYNAPPAAGGEGEGEKSEEKMLTC